MLITDKTKGDIRPLCLAHLRPMQWTVHITGTFAEPGYSFQKDAYRCSMCEMCYDAGSGYFICSEQDKRITSHIKSPICTDEHGFMFLADYDPTTARSKWECGCPGCSQTHTTGATTPT
jgi:hypothetical protein